MQFFETNGSQLIWRNSGETLVIEAWGPDSLRVRSVLMGDVRDDRFALLDPVPCADVEAAVTDETHAFVRCGKITAQVEVRGWKQKAHITFVNQHNQVLLEETDGENALVGFKIRRAEAFAFYPQTPHLEMMLVLAR